MVGDYFHEGEFAPAIEGMRHLRESRDALLAACEAAVVGAEHESCQHDDPDPAWHCCDWSKVAEQLRAAIKLAKEGHSG